MKTLNEMQIQVLEAAANPGGASPEGLDHRTVSSLIKKGLISDKRGRGNKHSLVTTPAGMELVQGRGVNAANTASMTSASVGAQAPRPMSHRLTKAKLARASEPVPQAAQPKSRKVQAAPEQPGSQESRGKLGLLIGLLRQPEGATLAAMVVATGWQAHSVRGAMAGAIKKRLGLTLVSEKAGSVRSWRITEARS